MAVVITAKQVQVLREMTNAGMMDCKRALVEAEGDYDKAVNILREKGLAAAAKKATRIAAEGVVYPAVYDGGKKAVMLEVNSETDFVAKNEVFKTFVKDVADVIAKEEPKDVDALLECKFDDQFTVSEALKDKIFKIGENLKLRRFVVYDDGYNAAYDHMHGKIGVIASFAVEGIEPSEALDRVCKDVCMQIAFGLQLAAGRGLYASREEVPAEAVAKEKDFLIQQAMKEGKPQNIAEKIVAGRINKFFQEVCVVDQAFIKDDSITTGKYLENAGKELGGKIRLVKFESYEKGEGLEKKQDDFAAEVARMVQK